MILATSIATVDISMPVILELGISFARDTAIQPVPVPISKTVGLLAALSIAIATSTSRSVSGRGMNTSLLTINVRP